MELMCNIQPNSSLRLGSQRRASVDGSREKNGRAVLSIYASENEDDDKPASYLKKNLRQSALDYERVTRSFFAISMDETGQSFIADATSLLAVPSYIVSTWCIRKAKKKLGTLW
jgi:hypothetical protein